MNYLLDTHTLLWIVTDNARLSEVATAIYLDSENDLFLSAASIWEMAIKINVGKLHFDYPLKEFIRRHVFGNAIKIMDIQLDHLYPVETLPHHHRDPFDRLIITQAMIENIPILSADDAFDQYPVHRIW